MFGIFKGKQQKELTSDNGENVYSPMRNMAFNVKPEDIGVILDNDEQVYGSIVDMGMGGGVATMVCFIDGTASLYFSSGGGIIGAGQHESVQKAVASYLVSIHQVLPITKATEDFNAVPEEDHHIFYLFTRTGKYTIDIDTNDIKTKETNFLFSLSQMVLTEIRKVSGKRI